MLFVGIVATIGAFNGSEIDIHEWTTRDNADVDRLLCFRLLAGGSVILGVRAIASTDFPRAPITLGEEVIGINLDLTLDKSQAFTEASYPKVSKSPAGARIQMNLRVNRFNARDERNVSAMRVENPGKNPDVVWREVCARRLIQTMLQLKKLALISELQWLPQYPSCVLEQLFHSPDYHHRNKGIWIFKFLVLSILKVQQKPWGLLFVDGEDYELGTVRKP
ncbi:hypothetical protein Tco_1091122 [Tanacetum coccineum]|uniref:Uncharacterized protein n=1 Tax=Tanacetum coccineum TaxID=301880 RepID=A0ABQ5I678_9ASTR